jgi:hypothetical protein
VKAAVYTEDMFKTTHDAANRAAVQAVITPTSIWSGLLSCRTQSD